MSGDALYQDAVAAIDRAPATRVLAAAHRAYAEASTIFLQDRFAEAAPRLTAAKALLEAAGSPYAHRVAIDIAATMLVRTDYAATLNALARAKSAARANGYAYLEARASWLGGLVAFAQGHLGDAQAHYEDTLATFERMNDAEQVALAHNLLAALYYYLGDKHHEWEQWQLALPGVGISSSVRVKSLLLGTAGNALRSRESRCGADLPARGACRRP